MRISLPDDIRIYIACGKTDMRKSIDGQLIISDISLGLFNESEKEVDLSILEPVPFEELIKKN